MEKFTIKFASMNLRKEEPSKPDQIMFLFKEKKKSFNIYYACQI